MHLSLVEDKKKRTKFWTYVQIRSTLRTLYPYMDKKSLDKYSSVYPTFVPKKFGHFGIKVCFISNFPHSIRNSNKHKFLKPSLT